MVDRVSHYFPHYCPVGPPSCCCCALHGGFHSVKIAGGCTHQNGPQFLTGRQRNKKLVPELMSPNSEPDKPPLTLLPAELDSLPVWSLSSHPIPSPCGCSLQSKEICHFTGQRFRQIVIAAVTQWKSLISLLSINQHFQGQHLVQFCVLL